MKLYSTNDKTNIVDLKEAVLNAFPKDRGLYMPTEVPRLPQAFLDNLSQYSLEEIGFIVAQNLIGKSVPADKLYQLISRAINFPAPLINLSDNLSTLELWHGPTMAFKDFGARFMAELMSYFLESESRPTTILVATSGDTGGAVASGFHGVPGINVVILYPSGKVSALQEKQLTTWGDNISAVEISGVFDDCQALVKQAFLDEDLNNKYQFSSANSINIARLLPQSFYYFEAIKQLEDWKGPITAVVPSGNFGNLTAGLLAQKMGLSINKFIAATNANDTVPIYLENGEYKAKPSIATLSNAMDVGNPSNFPRMQTLHSTSGSTWNNMRNNVVGYSYNDDETLVSIEELKDLYNYNADPHGAIGYLAAKAYLKENSDHHCFFLETAHPAKFNDVITTAIGIQPMPDKLKVFMDKKKEAKVCSKDYSDFKSLLLAQNI